MRRHNQLLLCNRYALPIAARSLGELQGGSETPVSIAIQAEQATRKFAQRTAARRVELKMSRRLRCLSVTGNASPVRTPDGLVLRRARTKGHAHSARLGGGTF